MDWQLAIAINVMALSAFSIVFALMRWRTLQWSWLWLHIAVLALGSAGLYLGFEQTGSAVAALFAPFVALPSYFLLRSNRAVAQGDYAGAAQWMRYAALLHPSRQMRFNTALTRAYAQRDAESVAEALLELKPVATIAQRTFLKVTAARMLSRWDEVISILGMLDKRQPDLLEYEIRALGELGRAEEMVRVYREIKPLLYGDAVRNCQLFVLAFCGRYDAVPLIAANKQANMHPAFAAYWRAVALVHSPEMRNNGLDALRELASHASLPNVRSAAQAALVGAMRPLPVLSPEAAAEAEAIAKRWDENAPLQQSSLWRSPVTLVLLAANCIMFALEYAFGGPEDVAALYKLGALWPGSLVDPQEWWRVVAAMFLHFGWAHLVLNMVSLALLGRMVEAVFGSARMALVYAIGGLGSMATVVTLMQMQVLHADFLVGASGAVMALIGAWTGRTLQHYLATRDVLDRRQAAALAVVMLGQFALDLSVPQVSFTAHATGFLIGLALGLTLARASSMGR